MMMSFIPLTVVHQHPESAGDYFGVVPLSLSSSKFEREMGRKLQGKQKNKKKNKTKIKEYIANERVVCLFDILHFNKPVNQIGLLLSSALGWPRE